MPTIDERIMEKFYEQLSSAPGVPRDLAEALAARLEMATPAKADDLAQLIISHSGDALA